VAHLNHGTRIVLPLFAKSLAVVNTNLRDELENVSDRRCTGTRIPVIICHIRKSTADASALSVFTRSTRKFCQRFRVWNYRTVSLANHEADGSSMIATLPGYALCTSSDGCIIVPITDPGKNTVKATVMRFPSGNVLSRPKTPPNCGWQR
jgi:hypothetical protein